MATSPAVPVPVTLIVGPEPVLVDRAVADVVAAVRAVDPSAERRIIDGASDDAAADIAEAVAPTLFGDGAIVVIESGESLDESALSMLTELIAAPVDGVAVVVVHEGKGNKGKRCSPHCAEQARPRLPVRLCARGATRCPS